MRRKVIGAVSQVALALLLTSSAYAQEPDTAPAPAGDVQAAPPAEAPAAQPPVTYPNEPASTPPSEGAYEYEQRVRDEEGRPQEPRDATLESGATSGYEEPAKVAEHERTRPRGPFSQGRTRISVVLGSGTGGFDDDAYLILGAGVGFFVLDGLALEADAQAWLFGDPFTATVTPGLRYVFYQVPKVHPYAGVFYRHYFVETFDDFDTYGARAGLLLSIGSNGYLGGGAVYERRFECDDTQFRSSCDQWYPEITFSLSF